MDKAMYDVIIVGGGPSGSSAAYFLAKYGIKCLLLDKAKFPRDKPCGGAITARAIEKFPHLKDLMEVGNYSGILHHKKPEEAIETTGETPIAYFIRRIKFDNDLVEIAKKEGVEVREDARVVKVVAHADNILVALANNVSIEGRYLIGADGVNSIVRKNTKLQKYWNEKKVALCFMNEIEFSEKIIEEFFGSRRKSHIFPARGKNLGYGWIFSKLNHINVGYGEIMAKSISPRGILQHYHEFVTFCQQNRFLPRFSPMIPKPRSWQLPSGGPMKHFSTDRIFLIGDAAGFVHPTSGEGILYSIWSAKIVVDCLNAVLQCTMPEVSLKKEYETRCLKEFALDLKKIAKLQRSVLKHIGFFFHLARFDPKLRELQPAVMDGRLPFNTIKWRMLKRIFIGIFRGHLWKK